METSGKYDQILNPRENANLLSIITFFYTFPILLKGMRKVLNENDIYKVLGNCTALTLGNNLQSQWEKECKMPGPKLLSALLRTFGTEYAILGIASLICNTALVASQPILLGKIITYFSQRKTRTDNSLPWYFAVGLPSIFLFNIMFTHSYLYYMQVLAFRIRIACSALIYRKLLKLDFHVSDKIGIGQLTTLLSKDCDVFFFSLHFSQQLCVGWIQTGIMTYIMYQQIRYSAIAGVSMLILFIPMHLYLGKQTAKYRLKTAEKTDERVRLTQEILTAIRIIKMYTWELFFSKSVSTLRKKEIRSLRLIFYIKALALSIGQLSSMLAFYICVMTYIAFGNHITAEKAYVVTGCFGALRAVLTIFMPVGIAQIAELFASIKRITDFLLLEEIDEKQPVQVNLGKPQDARVTIKEATVRSNGVEVLDEINLDIKSGITLLTGVVGSGKSTLLKLILGDVKKVGGSVDVTGVMAYASQDPWIFPGTVRQNIIFSELYDKPRYEAIIDVCALRKDLDSFPFGDKTCVTDRGLNLSRGQKARINLARAIYKKADIYLLDDCLSSVDTHVGRHIFNECIKRFLKDSICILVTHQLQLMQDVDNIVILNKGRVEFKGNYLSLKDWDSEEFRRIANQRDVDIEEIGFSSTAGEMVPNEVENPDESTKLLDIKYKNIYEETSQEGSVQMDVYYKYFTSGGGVKIFILVAILAIVAQATSSWSDYFVSFWVDMEQGLSGFRQNQTTNSTEYKELEASHGSIMTQYSLVIIAAAVFTLLRAFIFFIFSSKASIHLHNMALDRILNAAMKFFDANLSGNVINRFSRDFAIIDEQTPFVIFECMRTFLTLFAVLFVVSSVNALFLIPSAIFAIILYFAQRLYIPTGRSIRRLEGSTRSPVIGHLTATLEGLTTIRASQAQAILRKEFDRHQDLYNSVSYMSLATTRAFGFYLDTLSAFYMAAIILTFLFFKTDTLAGKVGLAITQSFSLTGLLQWGVRQWAELETQMTSVERVLEYTSVEPEEKNGTKNVDWPKYGSIQYEDVSLQYSPTSERVLKNVSFRIEPHEKIGVVGRTGAGKTSIISSLFRLYDHHGTISIDGVDIKTVEVELVRSNVSIIPQDPILFSGTIRNNLDPNAKHSDAEIWDALGEVEIKSLIKSLDADISEGGSNFSIGQRQQFCLVRAILNNNKILVLDEATANVDPQTDSLIQKTIRRKFADCTVITIAHRLDTILDSNKVMVMDSGMVIEFDSPGVLLNNRNGLFYRMVKESGLL